MAWCQSLGHSGQSTFWSVVYHFISKVGVTLQKTSYSDKFTESKCYLKRFAMAADCGNKHFYSTELVKKLTGGDLADVEHKHKDSFAARLYARVVAHSNIAPEIDTTSNAMKTRILFFTVRPFPEGEAISGDEIEARYRREFWHFLWACKQVERELCGTDHGPIPMPASMWESIRVRCDKPIRNMCRAFLNDQVTLDENTYVLEETLWAKFKDFYKDKVKAGAESLGRLGTEREAVLQAFENLIFQLLQAREGIVREVEGGMKAYFGLRLKDSSLEDEEDIVL